MKRLALNLIAAWLASPFLDAGAPAIAPTGKAGASAGTVGISHYHTSRQGDDD